MQDKPILGKLIDSPQQRDAIHIAVAPVIATEQMCCGQMISLVDPLDAEHVKLDLDTPIGIVDPFLRALVAPGQRFWMFLLPNTITSLRHDWTHPAFGQALAPEDLQKYKEVGEALMGVPEAKRWMQEFANRVGLDYDTVVQAGRDSVSTGMGYTQIDSQAARDEFYECQDQYWHAFEMITGIKTTDKIREDGWVFSCSC